MKQQLGSERRKKDSKVLVEVEGLVLAPNLLAPKSEPAAKPSRSRLAPPVGRTHLQALRSGALRSHGALASRPDLSGSRCPTRCFFLGSQHCSCAAFSPCERRSIHSLCVALPIPSAVQPSPLILFRFIWRLFFRLFPSNCRIGTNSPPSGLECGVRVRIP